nr:receptor-like protein Cf-9 [Quercus suber]
MASFLCYLMSTRLLFILLLFHALPTNCFSSTQPLCHDNESSALLQFKESFDKNENACNGPFDYPKTASWKLEGVNKDCCSWDGVECDEDTGHVIGLNLSSSCLYGSMASNSSLFRLVHLQRLNLAYNDFNFSQIPNGFGNLSRLTYLNLSNSFFWGQVPPNFSELSKLSSLDRSHNFMLYLISLKSLVRNLTSLEDLRLSNVQISSPMLEILSNLSGLTTLHLISCRLHGEFPVGIFKLQKLKDLKVSNNQDLTGYLPEFYSSSPLKSLSLTGTSFFGKLPASIGNLDSLNELHIGSCNFSGLIPPSLGNLTQLTTLDLFNNSFIGVIPSSFSNLIFLNYLDLSGNQLSGSIPSSFGKLVSLYYLDLSYCQLSGFIPSSFRNLTQLSILDLSDNSFVGQIPSSLSKLISMSYLDFSHCQLSGLIPSSFGKLVSLYYLDFSYCQLSGFIPSSFGFDQSMVNFPWPQLQMLDLRSNKLQALPLIPPPSALVYLVADNMIQGEISPLICNLSSLYSFDMSNNKLRGILPTCLSNFSSSLTILNLRGNNFHGSIPQLCVKGSRMKMIDLSQNQFKGVLPRSLSNCRKLEILNLGSNNLNDVFPTWLGPLPKLRVLILRHNGLYGVVGSPTTIFASPKLRILDISSNRFTGKLPFEYFRNWKFVNKVDVNGCRYMLASTSFNPSGYGVDDFYPYSMTIINKGKETVYPKIVEVFAAIDLSSNKFNGMIPKFIGNLNGFQLLNLSYNNLTGPIPHGNQFDTFDNSSFDGNSGLCGYPLSKKCENSKPSPLPISSIEVYQDSWFHIQFDWIIILMGYGSGLVIGVVIGNIMTEKK